MADAMGGMMMIMGKLMGAVQEASTAAGLSDAEMKDLEERGVIETQENGSVIIKERLQND